MDFWGDVLVSVLGSTGSLGVAYVIYRLTRNDEAGRLERTFAEERQARLDDQLRQHRAETAGGLTGFLADAASSLEQAGRASPSFDRDWIDETVEILNDRLEKMFGRLLLFSDEQAIFDDLQKFGSDVAMAAVYLANVSADETRPIQSYLDDLSAWCVDLARLGLTIRARVFDWQLNGIAPDHRIQLDVNQLDPGQPVYPTLPESTEPPTS